MIEGAVIVLILHVAVFFGLAELSYEIAHYLGETINAFAKLNELASAASKFARNHMHLRRLTSAFFMPHFNNSAGFFSLIAL